MISANEARTMVNENMAQNMENELDKALLWVSDEFYPSILNQLKNRDGELMLTRVQIADEATRKARREALEGEGFEVTWEKNGLRVEWGTRNGEPTTPDEADLAFMAYKKAQAIVDEQLLVIEKQVKAAIAENLMTMVYDLDEYGQDFSVQTGNHLRKLGYKVEQHDHFVVIIWTT